MYTVSGLVNGGAPVTATTGANGYYYLLEPAGTIATTGSPVLVYTANGARFVTDATVATDVAGTVTGLDIWGGWLRETTGESTLSSTQGLLGQAIGANADVSSLVGGLTDIAINASAPSFAFDQSINANTLDVTANAVSQTAGAITATALNLNGGTFTLGGANQIGAVSGSVGTIALTDGSSLSVGGSGLTATGDVSLNTSGDLTLDGPLSGAGVSLTAAAGNVFVNAGVNANTLDVTANAVSQTSGAITAATLNVNGGTFTLDGANQIGAVSGSVGTIALTDGSSLSVAGSGLAATGDVSLNTSGDLTLNGAVSGVDVTLTAATGNVFVNSAVNANTLGVTGNNVLVDAGVSANTLDVIANAMSQTSGAITATALNVNGGSFTLGGANQIGAVSGSVGTIALTDGSSLSVVGSGLAAMGDVSLNTSGDLTLAAPLSGAMSASRPRLATSLSIQMSMLTLWG